MSTEPRGFGARGDRNGLSGTNGTPALNTDDLLLDLSRYRDAVPPGETKRLLKRACRRLDKLEKRLILIANTMQPVFEIAHKIQPHLLDDEEDEK